MTRSISMVSCQRATKSPVFIFLIFDSENRTWLFVEMLVRLYCDTRPVISAVRNTSHDFLPLKRSTKYIWNCCFVHLSTQRRISQSYSRKPMYSLTSSLSISRSPFVSSLKFSKRFKLMANSRQETKNYTIQLTVAN